MTRLRIVGAPQDDAEPLWGIEAAERLFRAGWAVLPLGKGDDGKSPSVSFKGARRLPIADVLERMRHHQTGMYALRLDGVVVVDADTDNDATRDYIADRFGASPFQTVTRRGVHHFWRKGPGLVPRSIREPSIDIDIKSGPNAYIVGPGSVRADGVRYWPSGADLPSPRQLPVLVDRLALLQKAARVAGSAPGQRVPVGQRNGFLTKKAAAYAHDANSLESLRAELGAARTYFCDEPDSISDAELDGIAAWAWGLRCRNSLYGGRRSMVRMPRPAGEVLLPIPGGLQAFGLLGFLSAVWEHQPGKPFAIVPKAIIDAGTLRMGRDQIYDAIELLISTQFLVRVHRSRGKGDPSLYLLGNGGEGF